MKQARVLLAVVLVGIGAALTYHIFENLVHESLNLVWHDWFNSDSKRLLVVPLTILISLVFFGLQHYLDRSSEDKQEHGLGEMPTPNVKNYLKILLLGYFSLLAGASLGPEAILVPSCMLLGAFIGTKIFSDQQTVKLMAAAGLMALFTAFFFSIIVGVLSIFLVMRQTKAKFNPMLLVVSIIASLSSYLTLKLVSGSAFVTLPHYSWKLNFKTLLLCVVLAVAGYIAITLMSSAHKQFLKIRQTVSKKPWWQHALLASAVVAVFYLLGGKLVEFTGNQAIVPMFKQAASLGLLGLVWILIVKIAVISWSKAIGYRGGMIFPTIFLASVLVAILQLYSHDFNLIYGLIAVLVGAFASNNKTRILV